VLIDFGYCRNFLNSNKIHVKEGTQVDKFRGNLLFSSTYQMQFNKTSRRDDMISLAYLIIYIFNNGQFPGLEDFAASEKCAF